MSTQMNLHAANVDPETDDLEYRPGFLSCAQADALFAALRPEIPWERHRIRIFGREVDSPRLSCWIGDPAATYTYSRTRFAPRPWTTALLGVRQSIVAAAGTTFNSVLANLYRDGHDSMGWHSDDEPELGPAPVIASLNLGAVRRFVLRRRDDKRCRREIDLGHGSLLLMRGSLQRDWQHALPRTAKPMGERINLTFRRILVVAAGTQRLSPKHWSRKAESSDADHAEHADKRG